MSRRLLVQYFLAMTGYITGLFLLLLTAWSICNRFIWYEDDPLYQALEFVKEYILIFMGILILGGWIFVTYYFIAKPLGYLDEIVAASESLALRSEDPVKLSPPLYNVQNELNLVRERAVSDARAAKLAEQRKNDLVMYLAHDLKTPLSSVIGYLTLLKEEEHIPDELRKRYLSIAFDKAERLEDLINEFFEITRFNLSNITLEYGRINLTRMLEQIVYEFKPMFAEKNLECSLCAPADIMLLCDADKLSRVFDNLLRNAVNYSYENTVVQVTAQVTSLGTAQVTSLGTAQVTAADGAEGSCDKVVIRFQNQGNTIPKEKLERVFEQFYRLDSSRSTKSGGAGLGLAIAKQIVELHHGEITAYSEEGTTCFEVSLPL